MIGFTFAMALTRFEARRDAVLNEANAIETTALPASLLPDPHNAEALKLLRERDSSEARLAFAVLSGSECRDCSVDDLANALFGGGADDRLRHGWASQEL